MRISVIVPVFNCKRYLARCLESVKAQSYTDWECIVVDDSSTDGSLEEILRLVGGDSRFKVLSYKRNAGTATSRNRGMKEARGDALFFLDADDWLDPVILEYLHNEHLANPRVGRIFTPPIKEWEETGSRSHWLVIPSGFHRADSRALFADPGCDPGHVTGCLYVRKLIPADLTFSKVLIFEDILFNMGLLMAGVDVLITGREVYHYTRRKGSLVSSPYTPSDAQTAREALAALVEKYNPSEEMRTRFSDFLEYTIKRFLERNGVSAA